MSRVPPMIGAAVSVDVPVSGGAVRTVTRRIGTMRDHGDGRYTCILIDGPDGAETVTIAPHGAGWMCVERPADIQAAIRTAERILRGEMPHGSVGELLNLMARGVQQLSGAGRPEGPACPITIMGGNR